MTSNSSISIDPTTLTLKILECTNSTAAKGCSTQTYSLLPVIPLILGGRDYIAFLFDLNYRFITFVLIDKNRKDYFFVVPLVLNFLSQLNDGRPRLPPTQAPTSPTSPATPAPRVPDPLEDFATFVAFCSKVYGDQGEAHRSGALLI